MVSTRRNPAVIATDIIRIFAARGVNVAERPFPRDLAFLESNILYFRSHAERISDGDTEVRSVWNRPVRFGPAVVWAVPT